ncbi:4'-phosphopantetheinyl transferase family protein [Chimaeribacter arupi]|uniref:4'-phosphopantetheinyl transferase family protein n=1 Tax=Chimaeribacter arupi TaxID=2060066 RepID=UPI00294733BA|nr:4'-phosphopantetheinyl transferase superfamily protein [Chimaeribacter arupi]MDV5139674.1 4'-phosphopantetheinyl transferase superfamily protein [Chimaeribacter arupi]
MWSDIAYDAARYPMADPALPLAPLPERLSGAVTSRKADFQAGRLAAYCALEAAGAACCRVGASAQGIPLWPAGWRGSITHSAGRALAVAAPAGEVRVLGIDCEKKDLAAAGEIADVVLNPAERAYLHQTGLDFLTGVLIAFSAKESLYKALWPDVQHFFDFSAAEICGLDSKTQRIDLRLCETLSPDWQAGTRIMGTFCCEENYIITLIS